MSFLEDVTRYVERSASRSPWADLRVLFPEAEIKELGRNCIARWTPPEPEAGRLLRDWVVGEKGLRFVRLFSAHLLDEGLVQDAPSVQARVRQAFDYLALAPAQRTTAKPELEAEVWINTCWHLTDSPSEDFLAYSEELGLAKNGACTALGRVLLGLRGRDAIRWLLTLELGESAGPKDPWRLSSDHAGQLLASPAGRIGPAHSLTGKNVEGYEAIQRLQRLGLLATSDETSGQSYLVNSFGVALLSDALSPDSKFAGIARVLLDEHGAAALAQKDLADDVGRRAAKWVVHSVAHSLRNALTPAHDALQELGSALTDPLSREAFAKYGVRTQTGLDRAFKAVTDLIELYQSADAPPEPFELGAAIQDAGQLVNGGGLRTSVEAGLTLRGHRARFVQALAEAYRNARQAGAKTIEVGAVAEGAQLVVTIDDDGSGIAPDLRARVFEPGFSTRPEGSGQGLPLLKEVIEMEHHGAVSLGDAPIGGTRVTLRLSRG